jgi:hypothetical protein
MTDDPTQARQTINVWTEHTAQLCGSHRFGSPIHVHEQVPRLLDYPGARRVRGDAG